MKHEVTNNLIKLGQDSQIKGYYSPYFQITLLKWLETNSTKIKLASMFGQVLSLFKII